MKITVITVTYNAQDCLEQTIQSVTNQTYPNIEYIIVDGGSKDKTIDIIKKYESKISKWISEKDKGIYDAMNKGIDMATGEWINFMNAGDTFVDNNTIQKVFNHNYLEYDYIYGDRINKDFVGTYYEKATPFFEQKNRYCPQKGVCHQSTFVRKVTAQKFKFHLKFPVNADFKMMYDIYANKGKFLYRPIAIAIYNTIEGFSISGFKKGLFEIGIIQNIPINNKFKIWVEWKCLKNKINRFIKKKFHLRIISKQSYNPTHH